MNYIIGQIFGTCGAIVIIASFQFKDVKKLLVMQCISSSLFALQFLFIGGALSGFFCNVAGIPLRLTSFARTKRGGLLPGEKPGASIFRSVWVWAYTALFLGAMILFAILPIGNAPAEGWRSLITCGSMILFIFAIWDANPRVVRLMNFFACCPMWLVYNIVVRAIPGIITEIVNLTSILISWIRFFGKKKKA